MSKRRCTNDPDVFCYICGEFTVKRQRMEIDDFVQMAYLAYFGLKLGDQDKSWDPHMVCKTCKERLRFWTNGERGGLPFGIPMVWREPRNHSDDCYFCVLNVAGLNAKKRKTIVYPDLPSALRPVFHSEVLPVPIFQCLPELPVTICGGNEIAGPSQRELRPESISNISDHQQTSSGTEESQTEESNDESRLSPQCFNQ